MYRRSSSSARTIDSVGDVDVLPTPQFYYAWSGLPMLPSNSSPQHPVVKFLTVGEPHPDGTRTVFFDLNGSPRSHRPRPQPDVKQRAVPKPIRISPARSAPDSRRGIDRRGADEQVIQKGDQLLVMEAMKMQSTVYAPVAAG